MGKTDDLIAVIQDQPGATAAEIAEACKSVETTAEACQLLLYAYRNQRVDRVKVEGEFLYYLPGQAPQQSVQATKAFVVALTPKTPQERKRELAALVDKSTRPPQPAPSAELVTPDWRLIPQLDGAVLCINKDAAIGFILDRAACRAIAGLTKE